jgi:geranylgeranyl diphosphate synthase type I
MGGADAHTARLFRWGGRLLGTAFQIRDDFLGMYGDPAVTGKSSTGDAGRYKMTFPVVAAVREMSALQKRRLREIFRTRKEDAESRLRALLAEVNGEALTQAAAERYAAKAIAVVHRSGIAKEALHAFEEVAYYVATRSR